MCRGRPEELALPDQSFDFALCQLGLTSFPDRAAGLREIHRVLAPGGRLALNVAGPMPPLFAVLADALHRRIGPDAARCVANGFALAADQLAELLRDARFGQVEVAASVRTLRLPPLVDFLWQYVHAMPLGAAVAAATAEARADLEDDVREGWRDFVEAGRLTLRLRVTESTAQR